MLIMNHSDEKGQLLCLQLVMILWCYSTGTFCVSKRCDTSVRPSNRGSNPGGARNSLGPTKPPVSYIPGLFLPTQIGYR
jgi:hypothetical protein